MYWIWVTCVLNLGNMKTLLASKSLGRGLSSRHLAAPERLAKGFVLQIYIPIIVIGVLIFCNQDTSELCPSFACQSWPSALQCEWEYVTNKMLGWNPIKLPLVSGLSPPHILLLCIKTFVGHPGGFHLDSLTRLVLTREDINCILKPLDGPQPEAPMLG